ncbi:NAD(P)H-hydrate epimerase [Halomontanus rarus]|uniref:NAD(P)H-hydrate epimerase n=1 Tax=Halomontanus rarus TaxID=3034020 RepID=UPI0023E8B437|nr:NAD(P)H-hydrate epimerase [Halovivax sp. TS33]
MQAALEGSPRTRCAILERRDVPIRTGVEELPEPAIVVDALIGYGFTGEPTGQSRMAIRWATDRDVPLVALDVPSGDDVTSAERPGEAIRPTRTVTLALPKTGLLEVSGRSGA